MPRAGSEEVELYIRTYFSLLRSTTEVQIRTLEEVHAGVGSSLHARARSPQPDMSALIYSSLRLPGCIRAVERVVLGQSQEVFRQGGMGDVEAWPAAPAAARRRRAFYNGAGTLACYIASYTDIDDLIPLLTAFQIEWNKLHRLLRRSQARGLLDGRHESAEALAELAQGIGVEPEDFDRLRRLWQGDFWPMLREMADHPKRIRVRLLAGSLNDYRRATQEWWDNLEDARPDLHTRPVYFVSSNPHSLVNLYSGFALRQEAELLALLQKPQHRDLRAEWEEIESRNVPSSRENFLYYLLKKRLAMGDGGGGGLRQERLRAERECGVLRVPSEHSFDAEAQIIELRRIRTDWLDPRLTRPDLEGLRRSEALVVNIDYPLGMAAYQILSHVATRAGELRGVYILGKSAVLNGAIGDVVLPSVVFDEHSENTYLIQNCFDAAEVNDSLVYGTALDNQKAVCVRGTFLQTPTSMDAFYREGYTDIEMEAGPYLSAVYELYRPRRHPEGEIVDLHGLPIDLGILHYASDTPLSKGKNLGAGSLSYFGMDPTYGSSLAIWRRIFDLELARLKHVPSPQPAAAE